MSSDESSIYYPAKRKLDASEKTPVAVLTELCVAEGVIHPMFEEFPHETISRMFVCNGKAFNIHGSGSGRSKKEAKHEASANIIAQLAKMDRFKDRLQKVPQAPHTTSDGDAVGTLLDICVQREWPLPVFTEMQSCGQPHMPSFTILCTLSSIKCTGTFSKKKGAKQLAARAMLDIIQNFPQNDELKQVAVIESEPLEKLFNTYRELKDSGIKPRSFRLRDRHNFFYRLPNDDRNEAEKILMNNGWIYGTSKDKVDLVCAALKLQYDIKDIPNHQELHKAFMLRGNHDCVLADKEELLYDRVLEYFKTMLNLDYVIA